MPKTRRPASAKVRQAVVNEWRAHVDYAAALSPEQLAAPSKLTGWDVKTLVGHVAFTAGVELHELTATRANLEDLFFSLTKGEHTAPPPGWVPPAAPMGGAG